MHLLVRETHTLDAAAPAEDLQQTPAELLFLSFSDSDLGAAAMAWQGWGADAPSLRLANLARLRHPMSVDLYLQRVVSGACAVMVRLLGGVDYWRYGVEELQATCRALEIPLALLPGDGRADARLASLSLVPAPMHARLEGYLSAGGPKNLRAALGLLAHLAGFGADESAPVQAMPACGEYAPLARTGGALGVIVFYRSHLLAGDIAPIAALADALSARGLAVRALHVGSLKDPAAAAQVAACLRAWRPAVVLNCTAFSAAAEAGSPLDAADAPVLQAVLAGASHAAWADSARGLGQTDLAMQVVLPELDGRLLTTAISFKAPDDGIAALQYARLLHRPDAPGIALAADRAAGWARLRHTPAAARRVAVMLADYPGAAGQAGHAVGLDTFASLRLILATLREAGYRIDAVPDALEAALTVAPPTPFLSLEDYRTLLATLPLPLQAQIERAWGEPDADPAVQNGAFTWRHLHCGNLVVGLQPLRGGALDARSSYHDPELPPRHAYVAGHLWLRHSLGIHALVQLGAHGTLEWLPGKATALSDTCTPAALLRGLPVIYPFIVNNPGEAAAAKRRLGAALIGHLTPPLRPATLHGEARAVERMLEEYAAADGLDARRTHILRADLLSRAGSAGLLGEIGTTGGMPEDAALARLDAYLCDIKNLRIRDGLHVFSRAPDADRRDALLATLPPDPATAARLDACAGAERQALLAALDGRFIPPGPAGAPSRGRADVLPTGRNLTTVDPRAVPTRAAVTLAERAAEALLARHTQEHGEWPRRLVLDLWGSTTMRTGGEDFALALALIGARPLWDDASDRVSAIDILPLALLDRPRVDVSLRISGLFRDAFARQIELFDLAAKAIAGRDEAPDFNPLAGTTGARVFGPAPGCYGAGVTGHLDRGAWTQRRTLGESYLEASAHAWDGGADGHADLAGFSRRVATADAFVHIQDHAETDLLESTETAAHIGGFAAAAALLGGTPALYEADTSRPDAPRLRSVEQAIMRIVRGRAANPDWLAGRMRHGYRGAAEIARTVEVLHAYAATLPHRLDRAFDLLFSATLDQPEVAAFLRANNPAAHAAMSARFEDAWRRGLWQPRRNDIAATLAAGP
jgi:cobaltochelatase CobN